MPPGRSPEVILVRLGPMAQPFFVCGAINNAERKVVSGETSPKNEPEAKAFYQRGVPRYRAKRGIQVSCLRGSLGLGNDLAVGVLDLSELGIGLILKSAVDEGQELMVYLATPGGSRVRTIPARVIWCQPLPDGNFRVGAEFARRMPYGELTDLVQMSH